MSTATRACKRLVAETKRYNESRKFELARGQQPYYYYFTNPDNVQQGYGLCLGPQGTPFQGGFFLIEFTYSDLYPTEPPTCKYITVCPYRQCANLYVNGYVCLSTINTWPDKNVSGWKATLGFEAVLKAICSDSLVKPALSAEPSSKAQTKDHLETFDHIARYCTLKYNVGKMYELDFLPPQVLEQLKAVIKEQVLANQDWYRTQLAELSASPIQGATISSYYGDKATGGGPAQKVKIDYLAVAQDLEQFLACLSAPDLA